MDILAWLCFFTSLLFGSVQLFYYMTFTIIICLNINVLFTPEAWSQNHDGLTRFRLNFKKGFMTFTFTHWNYHLLVP